MQLQLYYYFGGEQSKKEMFQLFRNDKVWEIFGILRKLDDFGYQLAQTEMLYNHWFLNLE